MTENIILMSIYNFLKKKKNRRKLKRVLITLLIAFIALKAFFYMGNESAKTIEKQVESGAKRGIKEVQSIYKRYR